MGSRIAAHLANAGFPVDLLDIVLPGQPKRNQAALQGIESASKQKPVAFMTESAKSLIAPGNFEDDLVRVATEALASTCEEKRARAAGRLREASIRVSLRGYDRSQVDSWLRHTLEALA